MSHLLADDHAHAVIVGRVGVGKTFLAHALGHVACRRGHSVLPLGADRMLTTLRHARLGNTYEIELCRLLAVDLLITDDFALEAMDPTDSRDIYEIMIERYRAGSMIITSNRGPDEWLATFADLVHAPSAMDRFASTAYDLRIDGESYRGRLKPPRSQKPEQKGIRSGNLTMSRPRSRGHGSETRGSHPPENRQDSSYPTLGAARTLCGNLRRQPTAREDGHVPSRSEG